MASEMTDITPHDPPDTEAETVNSSLIESDTFEASEDDREDTTTVDLEASEPAHGPEEPFDALTTPQPDRRHCHDCGGEASELFCPQCGQETRERHLCQKNAYEEARSPCIDS